MRHCRALIFFTAIVVVSGAAQQVPPGSYQQSCRDIRLRGDSLRATCQTSNGNWLRTSLDEAYQCVGDITNIEGRLTCNRYSSPPDGTYLQSCRNVRVRYNTLWARCKTMNGQWVDTSLNDFYRCAGGIGNFDGQLRCGSGYRDRDHDGDRDGDRDRDRDRDRDGDRDRNRDGDRDGDRNRDNDRDRDRDRGNGPRGSYSQTCRDIQVYGDSLRARCETSTGRWLETSLDDYNRCVGEVVNDEGHLECTRAGGRNVPPGTYSQTCRQIYVRGDFLRAQCETRDGHWVWTQLNDWDSCRSITNLDGQLHCDR